jgi:hypothetical protein
VCALCYYSPCAIADTLTEPQLSRCSALSNTAVALIIMNLYIQYIHHVLSHACRMLGQVKDSVSLDAERHTAAVGSRADFKAVG